VLVHDDATARSLLTGALDATVGLSRPFPADAPLAVARREALWALDRAAEAGRDVVSYGDGRTERWLTSDSADLRALVEQVLGAVIDYDAAHAGDLVTSVRVWLEHDRQTDRAASALCIHPNTLLYRVRRFEQISGRSLTSTESLAEIWLALRTTAAPGAARTRSEL
jgi:PucR family transcriptional regulator, purine catabolism regulatory protein